MFYLCLWALVEVLQECVSSPCSLLGVLSPPPLPVSSCTSSKANRNLHPLPVLPTCLIPLRKIEAVGFALPAPACIPWHCSLQVRRGQLQDTWYSSWGLLFDALMMSFALFLSLCCLSWRIFVLSFNHIIVFYMKVKQWCSMVRLEGAFGVETCMQFCFSLPTFQSPFNLIHPSFCSHFVHEKYTFIYIYIFYLSYQVLLVTEILFYV